MLTRLTSSITARKIRYTRVSEYPSAQPVEKRERVRSTNVAQPYATEAVTANSPIRLSQPV